MLKLEEKIKAVEFRKKGLSYSEITKELKIARSTLSVWLREIGLSKPQKQRLTKKKLASMKRGWEAWHNKRVLLENEIKCRAEKEVKKISKRELWLIGVALYWAEGNKEKKERPGSGVLLSNSDPKMIKIFLKWLMCICNIPKEMITLEIYIHENNKHRLKQVIDFWSEVTNFDKKRFTRIYFKKNKIKTKRINTGNLYYGLIRIKVKKSSFLNRKITGWIQGINKNFCGMV